jgi:hypothetical protein
MAATSGKSPSIATCPSEPGPAGTKARQNQRKSMSRFSFILLSVVIIIVVALVALSFVNTEKPPVTVEKAMLNEAHAQ